LEHWPYHIFPIVFRFGVCVAIQVELYSFLANHEKNVPAASPFGAVVVNRNAALIVPDFNDQLDLGQRKLVPFFLSATKCGNQSKTDR
jgi:hypothetical protein